MQFYVPSGLELTAKVSHTRTLGEQYLVLDVFRHWRTTQSSIKGEAEQSMLQVHPILLVIVSGKMILLLSVRILSSAILEFEIYGRAC